MNGQNPTVPCRHFMNFDKANCQPGYSGSGIMKQMQHAAQKIRTFTLHHPLIGPTFWILSVQYFLTQLLVANAWPIPFDIRTHAISDLGNTVCGTYEDRFVCSPEFSWMNASFVVLGVTIIIGSALLYQGFKRTRPTFVGFYFMSLAGLGTVFVGLFSENTIPLLHNVGAFMPFVFGNLSMVILGVSLEIPRSLKLFSMLFGITALIALILFTAGIYLGLGFGGMERLVAYPQTIWLIVCGVYVSAHRYRETHRV